MHPKNLFARARHLSSNLPPLLIDAEQIAQTVWQGVHGRRRAGIGEDFWQFRRYDAGDPAERIDWRQSARTDKIFVREREWQATQSACLWPDASGSMHYASEKNLPTKSDCASILMLAMASLLLRGGERSMWSDGEHFTAIPNHGSLENIAANLNIDKKNLLPLPPPSRHAHMILASDFLMPDDALPERIRLYAVQNLQGILLHIIDPLEEFFALDGHVELRGAEQEQAVRLPNAASLQGAYRQKFSAHEKRLRHIAKSAGWLYQRHVTNGSMQQSLLHLYRHVAG